MTVLGTATTVYAGSQVAKRVYLGDTKVWPLIAPPVGDATLAGQNGDWIAKGWGKDGWVLADGSAAAASKTLPPGVTYTVNGPEYSWNPSHTSTWGMIHSSGTYRVSCCWYNGGPLDVSLTFAEAWQGTVRFYFMSQSTDDRSESVTPFLNGVQQGPTLNLMANDPATWFGTGVEYPVMLPGGRWLAYDLNVAAGSVFKLGMLFLGGGGGNNVISGMVFDAFVQPFSPTDISGLVTWLDAADYTPGAWPNKGPGPTPTIVGTPVMTAGALQNGLATVRFKINEGRLRSTWPYPVHDYTVLYLVRWVGPNAGRAFSVQYPPSNLLVGAHTTSADTMYDNGTWLGGLGWNVWQPPPGPWRMYGADCQQSDVSRFFVNGTFTGSPAVIDGGGFTGGWGISGYESTGPGETMDIEIAELLIWNRRLSDPERLQAQDYLRAKWGLS